jgi:autotransporter-associated beta strand protein
MYNINRRHPLPIAALAALLLCAPAAGLAQSILLTAGDFALLGGTAITSTGVVGTTIRNGNVGLSPGATTGITGFPPAVVVNGSIIATGPATGQARLDLINAANRLAALPSTANMSNVDLGGTTLAPGVYTFNGAASLNGALVLDAQGQNNVAWVFQIGTALTTSVNSSVTFINLGSNGGSDLGLFWNAGSAITIGANNAIAGNYLAGTSIAFGALADGGGRALVLAGISLDNDSINARGGPAGGDLTGGLTFNSSGALVGSGSVQISSSGAYTAGGSGLVLTPGTARNTLAVTVDGIIANGSGAASLTVTGATATLTGINTYTGGTIVDGGTLITSSANLPANRSVAINSTSRLVFNQTTTGAFGGAITGGGTIEKSGTGALTLTTVTTSPVDLRAGSLYFTSGLGATTIASGAFLGGSGTITGNLINRGTLSPGFSPATIVVTGNYTQTSTGLFLMEIASATSFDQLTVTGTATLAGALQVDLLAGYDPRGQSFTFLTAAGGVSGTFGTSSVTGSAATAATLTYTPNTVMVSFAQLPFAGFATTPNQASTGSAAQSNPTITAALNAVPLASQIPAALDAISPHGYGIWSDIAFARSTALAIRLGRDDGATADHDNFYFDASQRHGNARRDSDVGENTFTSSAALVGGDHVLNPNLTLGGFFDYSRTDAGLGSSGSSTEMKSKMFGARAAWGEGGWFAHGVLAYAFDDYEATRYVTFPGTSVVANSSTRGRQWIQGATAGRRISLKAITLSPFASVLSTRWSAKGFTETGAGAFNATFASQSARSLRTQLGVDVRSQVKLGGLALQPHARAAWQHEFSDDARAMYASFGGPGYAVTTPDPKRDSALLSAGLDFVLGPRAVLYTEYSAQTGGSTVFLDEWRVGLAVSF